MIGMLHYRDCGCEMPGLFTCRHCKRTVGWCNGCYDSVEDIAGPICDDCWARIPKPLLERVDSGRDRRVTLRRLIVKALVKQSIRRLGGKA